MDSSTWGQLYMDQQSLLVILWCTISSTKPLNFGRASACCHGEPQAPVSKWSVMCGEGGTSHELVPDVPAVYNTLREGGGGTQAEG